MIEVFRDRDRPAAFRLPEVGPTESVPETWCSRTGDVTMDQLGSIPRLSAEYAHSPLSEVFDEEAGSAFSPRRAPSAGCPGCRDHGITGVARRMGWACPGSLRGARRQGLVRWPAGELRRSIRPTNAG